MFGAIESRSSAGQSDRMSEAVAMAVWIPRDLSAAVKAAAPGIYGTTVRYRSRAWSTISAMMASIVPETPSTSR